MLRTCQYVRRGAILMSVAAHQYTTEKPWDPVVLDVYPPASGTVSRTLYEDDGVTQKYLQGECSKTTLSVAVNQDGMTLTIGPAQGDFREKPPERAWLVRLHCGAADADERLTVQGAAVVGSSAWDKGPEVRARILFPQASPDPVTSGNFPIPFRGEGTAPGPQAMGPVIEIWLPPSPASQSRTLTPSRTAGAADAFR